MKTKSGIVLGSENFKATIEPEVNDIVSNIVNGRTIIFTDDLGRKKECKVLEVKETGLDLIVTLREIN